MMIRDKILKLHRHKSSSSSTDKSGHSLDFSFSNFCARQVPKGWDKLSVSLISVETGKTVSKSGKASVRNGNCQWTETWAQSIWITPDDISNKQGQCAFKFIVTMGSSRSSVLGEAALNFAHYKDAKASTPVSLPLRKCNHGTVLQLEIKCLTAIRYNEPKDVPMYTEEENVEYKNMEIKSEETGIPALSSCHSFGSTEDSLDRESFSSQSDSNRPVNYRIARQESTDSRSSASCGSYSFCDSPKSSNAPYNLMISGSGKIAQNQKDDFKQFLHDNTASVQLVASSRNSTQGRDITTKELIADAMMWEQNSRSLKIDLEMSRKEFADQTQQIAKLEMEVCSLGTERDGLMQQTKHLEVLLQESLEKEKATGSLLLHVRDMENAQKLLKEELGIQKESNDSLSLQFSKTQESNIQLLSILQEMEETVEKQKLEIENLLEKSKSEIELEQGHRTRALLDCEDKWKIRSSEQEDQIAYLKAELSRISGVEDSETNNAKLAADCDLVSENETLKGKLQELERDCKELTEENMELLYKLKSKGSSSSSSSILSSSSIEDQPSEKDDFPKENTPCSCCQRLEELNKELQVKVQNLSSDNLAKNSEILEMKTDSFEKDAEIKALRHHQTDLRIQISNLEMSKCEMQERMENMQQELNTTPKSLDNSISGLMLLDRCTCGGVSEMSFKKKSLELESDKYELELILCELEKENVHLSERVSGLEAQLRHLTDAIELNRLELQHSGSCVVNLQDKIRELQHEKELQKLNMKEKLQEMQMRWLDAQEECEYLKQVNPKLQATTEIFMEECLLLQNLNAELRKQKLNHTSHNILEMTEENSCLKMKLQALPLLHEEVVALKGELSGKKFESERLQVSLQLISDDCEELKAENTSLFQKISHMQKAVAEAEECKYKKIALEEKVLRLEGDLTAKEVMCAKVSELKNELSQLRRANNQFLGKIKSLQLEKEECMKQFKSLGEDLKRKQLDDEREDDDTIPTLEQFKLSEAEKEELGKHRCEIITESPQSDKYLKFQKIEGISQQDGNKESNCNGNFQEPTTKSVSVTQLLGNTEEAQTSEGSFIHGCHHISLSSKGGEENMHKICELETEVQEIRDCYLQMSLKYAEAEDQREQLVMTLKAIHGQKTARGF